jgi:hypothetical protein
MTDLFAPTSSEATPKTTARDNNRFAYEPIRIARVVVYRNFDWINAALTCPWFC